MTCLPVDRKQKARHSTTTRQHPPAPFIAYMLAEVKSSNIRQIPRSWRDFDETLRLGPFKES